jgi:uncharacterized membrane protein HdeD (DUF308 family)
MSYVDRETFDNPYTAELQSLRRNWGWYLVLGIALVIIGVLALGQPYLTALAGNTVFAVMLLIAAGVEIASAIFGGRWRGFFFHLLAGLLYLVVGIFMLEDPVRGILGLVLILAAMFMAKGVLGIILALTQHFHAWGWVLFDGIVSLILGIFIWKNWPWDAKVILTIFIGIEIIFNGWTWIMLALSARQIPKAPVSPAV